MAKVKGDRPRKLGHGKTKQITGQGSSRVSRFKNKHKRKGAKKYRGQGK